jgi:hypothetical protein
MVKRSRLPKGQMFSPSHRLEAMPMMFYASWYNKDVSPNLTKAQKEKLLMKISNYSLEHNITLPEVEVPREAFPELIPFMHTEKLSGLQLYAVMTELFGELHPVQSKKIGKSYPSLPF